VLPSQKHPVKCASRFIVSSFYNIWWLYVMHSFSLTVCADGSSKAAFVRHLATFARFLVKSWG
jgi:hypothetical protein